MTGKALYGIYHEGAQLGTPVRDDLSDADRDAWTALAETLGIDYGLSG